MAGVIYDNISPEAVFVTFVLTILLCLGVIFYGITNVLSSYQFMDFTCHQAKMS